MKPRCKLCSSAPFIVAALALALFSAHPIAWAIILTYLFLVMSQRASSP